MKGNWLKTMDAVGLLQAPSSLKFSSCVCFSKQLLNLGKFSCCFKDGSSAFTLQKSVLSSIKGDGSRSSRSLQLRRTKKNNTSDKYMFSDCKLPKPKQEEILSLLGRIKHSISKGDNRSSQQTGINLSKGKSQSESVLEALHQSKKPTKDATPRRGQDGALSRKQGVTRKDYQLQDAQRLAAKFKVSRPPSKFVRRSPIPNPSIQRGSPVELNSNPSAAAAKVLMLPRVEEMKLPQLKELAKSRGITGYSKLKKGELLEMLRS